MSNLPDSRRKLSVYEKQQLYRANLTEADLLSQGEMPVEYLTGRVDFAEIEIAVNSDVLIPRVESEEMVALAEEYLLALPESAVSGQTINVLELGTGSGAISLALMANLSQKKNQTNYAFTLADLSAAALQLASQNYYKLLTEGKIKPSLDVTLLPSDLFDNIKQDRQFELILANLPYIPKNECQKLAASVKDFEPMLALDGGENGFVIIAKALEQVLAGNFLADQGQIILEVHESHNQVFIEREFPWILERFSLQFLKDQFDRQRFIILTER